HTGGGNGTATHGSSNRAGATQASVKVAFSAQAGPSAAWTPASITCSTTYCHGQGAPVWGTPLWSTTDQCGKCHSSTAAGAVTAGTPFYSTSYPAKVTANTDAKAGAHTSHITSTDSLTAALNCSDCHGTVTFTGATHMNGAANFTWSTLATKGGALTPAYSAATGQCSNVYCHGASMPGGDTAGSNRTPTWNVAFLSATLSRAACASCHGFPPAAASGHPAVTLPASWPAVGAATGALGTTCSCHANISTTGTTYANIFVNKALHIDGTVQVSGGHAVPYDTHKADVVAAGGNTACLGCHAMGTAASPYPAAVIGNPPDCMSCHLKAAPVHTGTVAGANCSSCHGLSTATTTRIGRPVGTAYPDRIGYHGGSQDGAHGTAACTVCHNGAGTTSGNNSGINHGKGSTAGPVRNGKPNVVGPMVNGITPTNSAKGVGIPANGTTCVHGTISAGCSGGGTQTNRW
ncbi:MAG: CxxxxCH/CxxCH domain-containing protein, partial [Pelobacteraceae bacterium]